jgi:hypothetical protein
MKPLHCPASIAGNAVGLADEVWPVAVDSVSL